jgi:hypothetical protein
MAVTRVSPAACQAAPFSLLRSAPAEMAKGVYTLLVSASDAAGNIAWRGAYVLTVED